MEDKKILGNIEPFQGVKMNCFLNALFPALTHFNKDVTPLFLKKTHYYKYNADLNIELIKISIFDYMELFYDLGIEFRPIQITNANYIETICREIENGKLVISNMDVFFDPLSPGTFNKVHTRHGILIYGYNKKTQTFNIIDHDYINDFIYKKNTISFDDILNCFIGYNEKFESESIIISIFSTHAIDYHKDKYINKFKDCMKNNLGVMRKGLLDFERFLKDLVSAIENDQIIQYDKNIRITFQTFNNMVNIRNFDHVSFDRVFKDENISKILSDLIGNYNYVRAILFKYVYSNNYNKKSFLNCMPKFADISYLENQFLDSIENL